MLVASATVSTEPPNLNAALETLRVAQMQLRALSEVPSADSVYAQAMEQVAAIVTELERRVEPASLSAVTPSSKGLDPVPPNPG